MSTKKPLSLIILAALTLVSAVYFWLQREGAPSAPTDDSFRDPETGRLDSEVTSDAEDLMSAATREHLERTPSGTGPRVRTTWSAGVVTREAQRPVPGVKLRVKLLSPEAATEDMELVSGADGEAGPIDIPFDRHPAAEVTVDPSPQWAGLTSTVRFTAGKANRDILELAPPATLIVKVLDLVRNAPLSGAVVTLHDASGVLVEVICDGQGFASLPWEAAGGPFSVRASAPGYSAVSWADLPHPPSADQELELMLAPAGVLRARVQDENGRTLSGCRVTSSLVGETLSPFSSSEVRVTAARWDAPAEESGLYVFSSLPCEAILALVATTEEGLEGRALAKISAPPGVAEATITVARVEGMGIWTFDEGGAPLAGVTIGMDKEAIGATDEIGHLTLPLQESRRGRELWAFKAGYALVWQGWAPELRGMVYRLTREQSISGIVIDSGGRPQRLVRVTPLLGEPGEPRDVRQRRGELLLQKSGARPTGTDASGAFTLASLGAGWIDLHVRPPKGSPFEVRDIPVGTPDLVVRLPDEGALGRDQGIALSFLVLDKAFGAPVSGASVTVFYAPDGQMNLLKDGRTGSTKSDGRVRLTFAQEGSYMVMVTADGYVPSSSAVVDYPIGEHEVTVELAPAGELDILLVDAGGAPQTGYWISALDAAGAPVPFENVDRGARSSNIEIMSDMKGRAFANRMPTGKLTLEVREEYGRNGAILVQKGVEVIPGKRLEVELRLP